MQTRILSLYSFNDCISNSIRFLSETSGGHFTGNEMYTSTNIKYVSFHHGVFSKKEMIKIFFRIIHSSLKTLGMFCTLLECDAVSQRDEVPVSNEPSVRLVPLKCLLNIW